MSTTTSTSVPDATLRGGSDDAEPGLLREFRWPEAAIVDLVGIVAAYATEMYARLYFTLVGVLDTFDFNIAIFRA